DGSHPGVGQVRAAVGAVALDERAGKDDGSAAVADGPQAVIGNGGDREDRAVMEALPAAAEGAVDQDPVADGVAALAVVPGGTDQFRAADVTGVLETLADAVGEVFAVGVGDGEGDDTGGTVGGGVGGDGSGEGFPGGVGGAEVVFPAVLGADGLAEGDVAGPVVGQRLALGGFELAAVLGELRSGDPAFVAEAGEFGAKTAGPHCLGLVGITKAPEPGAGGGGHCGVDDLGVGGGDLGDLVEDHDRAGMQGGAVEGEPGDGHGRHAGLAEFADGLVGGRKSDQGVPGGGGGHCRGVDRGRLPEPGGGDQAPDGGAALAQGPHGVGLVGAEPGSLSSDGTLHHARVEPGDRGGGEVVEMVEDSPCEQEVVPGGVQSGAPPGAVDQGDSVVGVQKGRCEVLDGV